MWDVPARTAIFVDALAGCNSVTVKEPSKDDPYSVGNYVQDQICMWLDYVMASLKRTKGNNGSADCSISYAYNVGVRMRRNGIRYLAVDVDVYFDFTVQEYKYSEYFEIENDWSKNALYYKFLSNIWGYKITHNSSKGPRSAKKMTKWTESALRAYWKENGFKEYEGIYENFSGNDTKYKLALKYINNKPYLIYLSGGNFDWQEGEVKATLESSSYGNGFKCNWKMLDKSTESTFMTVTDGIMKVMNGTYVKMYPTASEMEQIASENSKWSGTCFAIGGKYVATNYHVVEDAKNLVVSGIKGSYSKDYAVEVVVTDKINDLAILKITEPGFTGFGALKYGFKTQTTDIGTDVFVLGYPLITTMGEDIKLTTGVISSKSGFMGDVSQYQISAPVQPGNSGGPLFDNRGNVIGIVSAKHTGAENAGYAIKLSYLKNLAESANETIALSSTNTISTLSLPEKVKAISSNVLIVKANFLDGKKAVAQTNSSVPKSSSSSSSSTSAVSKSGMEATSYTESSNNNVKTFTINGYSFDMIYVEGGTFTMGATSEQGTFADSDEYPTHKVTVDGYYMGIYEVTQGLWLAVWDDYPSYYYIKKGDNYPMEIAIWNDCQEFIKKLNQKTGKKFRLPTESEWEFAARGGNKSRGYKYSGSNTLTDVAWYNGNSNKTTHPVGQKLPNELGIYDMSGNLWEWVSDWYGSYSGYSQTNPTGASPNYHRVMRGGSYDDSDFSCRSSERKSCLVKKSNDKCGLRLVLEE